MHLICRSAQNFFGGVPLTIRQESSVSPGIVSRACYLSANQKNKEKGYSIPNQKIATLYLGNF